MAAEWKWWVGTDGEHYSDCFDTREEAVYAAAHDYDGGWIIEARQDPLELSSWFEAENFIGQADERATDDFGNEDGGLIFDPTPEQTADLESTVRAAIDAWQERHGLKFNPYRFTASRNGEYIPAKAPEDA